MLRARFKLKLSAWTSQLVVNSSTDILQCPILVFCFFQLKASTESNKRSNIRECCKQDLNSNCLHKHPSFPLSNSSDLIQRPVLVFCLFQLKKSKESNTSKIRECCEHIVCESNRAHHQAMTKSYRMLDSNPRLLNEQHHTDDILKALLQPQQNNNTFSLNPITSLISAAGLRSV